MANQIVIFPPIAGPLPYATARLKQALAVLIQYLIKYGLPADPQNNITIGWYEDLFEFWRAVQFHRDEARLHAESNDRVLCYIVQLSFEALDMKKKIAARPPSGGIFISASSRLF